MACHRSAVISTIACGQRVRQSVKSSLGRPWKDRPSKWICLVISPAYVPRSSLRYNILSMVIRPFDDVLEQLLDCMPFTVIFQYLYTKLKFKDVLLPFLFITYKGNVNLKKKKATKRKHQWSTFRLWSGHNSTRGITLPSPRISGQRM